MRERISPSSLSFSSRKKKPKKKKKRERENGSNEIKSLRIIKENEMKRIFKIIVLLIIAKKMFLSKDFHISLSLSCFVTRLSFRVSGARRPSPPLSRHAFSDPRILIGPSTTRISPDRRLNRA